MKKLRKKFTVLLVLLALVAIFYLMSYERPPTQFVTNRTFETRSDLLFKYEVTRYPTSAEVSPVELIQERLTLGVVVDPWNLKFGIIPAGKNFGSRFVNLLNMHEKDAKISFKVYGNISPFVTFSRNNFILRAGENTTVEVQFHTGGAAVGNYTGEIQVIVQRPKYDFLYSLW